MEIVRKFLSQNEVQPANTRYNDVTDTVEVTNDGGSTWSEAPTLDPRRQYQQPPVDTSDPKCDAAARMSAELESLVTAGIAGVDSAADAIQIGNIILSGVALMVGAPLFSALIFSAANYLISTGSTVLHSEFDAFDWDELTCQFLCVVNDEGRLDEAGQAEIVAYLNTLTLVQSALIGINLTLLGYGGLSDYAAARTETGDCTGCEDCEWCYHWNFRDTNGSGDGWIARSGYGQWVSTQGWQRTPNAGLILELTIPGGNADITRIDWAGNAFNVGAPNGRATFWRDNGVTLINDNQTGLSGAYTCSSVHTESIDEVWLNPYGGTAGADYYIQDCWIYGTGTNPWGEGNC